MRRFLLTTAATLMVAATGPTVVTRAQYGEARQVAGTPTGPTPRMADGKPDLSGFWAAGLAPSRAEVDEKGNIALLNLERPPADPGQAGTNFERDAGLLQRADVNIPLYKAEYWDKIQYNDVHGNMEDPSFKCNPDGVPRMGAPQKIVQTPTEIIFMYNAHNTFRAIPTDGRPHHPEVSLDQTWMGDSVGHWEGDTLVIETIGFNDVSWLDWAGYMHSAKLKVIERLTRQGNVLRYQATAEDPVMLLEPWVMEPRTLRLNTDPINGRFMEDLPCHEYESEHIVTKERG